jgi:hypothetical protein
MPGIEMSHTEQQEYYESLLKEYKQKTELLNKYKQLSAFDTSNIEAEGEFDEKMFELNRNLSIEHDQQMDVAKSSGDAKNIAYNQSEINVGEANTGEAVEETYEQAPDDNLMNMDFDDVDMMRSELNEEQI